MKLIFQHGDGRLLPAGDVVRPVQRGAQAGILCFTRNRPATASDNNTTSTVISFDMVPALKTLTAGRTYQPEEHRCHEINQRGKIHPAATSEINVATITTRAAARLRHGTGCKTAT